MTKNSSEFLFNSELKQGQKIQPAWSSHTGSHRLGPCWRALFLISMTLWSALGKNSGSWLIVLVLKLLIRFCKLRYSPLKLCKADNDNDRKESKHESHSRESTKSSSQKKSSKAKHLHTQSQTFQQQQQNLPLQEKIPYKN